MGSASTLETGASRRRLRDVTADERREEAAAGSGLDPQRCAAAARLLVSVDFCHECSGTGGGRSTSAGVHEDGRRTGLRNENERIPRGGGTGAASGEGLDALGSGGGDGGAAVGHFLVIHGLKYSNCHSDVVLV